MESRAVMEVSRKHACMKGRAASGIIVAVEEILSLSKKMMIWTVKGDAAFNVGHVI